MRRISSLPTAEFCPKVDKIGQDIESTQSLRSTYFHAYCDTGAWPKGVEHLPEEDREEIEKWRVPLPFVYKVGDVTHALQYKNAFRETRVSLDHDFNWVEVDADCPQEDIAERYPQVMITGKLDMAWVLREYDLVIVGDIKSSIFAVSDKTDSLQLHGYGMGMAAKYKVGRYVTAIWDACDGQWFVSYNAVEVDGFDGEDLRVRIRKAATERDGNFLTGTHCRSCWKRRRCPANLVPVSDAELAPLFNGTAKEADVRRALVRISAMGELANEAKEACKAWFDQHGYVRSEDGKKVWAPAMRKGKSKLDEKAVARALGKPNLSEFMVPGGEFPQFSWRKRDE